jgi:hypothetical protein
LSGDSKEIHTNIFRVPTLFLEIAVSGLYESAAYNNTVIFRFLKVFKKLGILDIQGCC